MTKKTYGVLSKIPLVGSIVKMACDPMLGCSPSLDEGLPPKVRKYIIDYPETFITKRLLREIMSGAKK